MFYSLTGKIIHKDEQSVALLVGGVGFKCFTTRSTIARINAILSTMSIHSFAYSVDTINLFIHL